MLKNPNYNYKVIAIQTAFISAVGIPLNYKLFPDAWSIGYDVIMITAMYFLHRKK